MMRREVERLRLDTALLRAARDKDSSLLKELKERKRLLDLQLHEQSKVIDLTRVMMDGERRAADAEWGDVCTELKDRLFDAKRDLKVYQGHAARSRRPTRQLDVQSATQ